MIKNNITLLYILLIIIPHVYKTCNRGCLKCNTQQPQAFCEICDQKNYYFLKNGICFQNYDKFCTKYSSNGFCLQCKNKRSPNINNPFECKKLKKFQQIKFCYEYSAQNNCVTCKSGKYLNEQGQCQDIDTYIRYCKIYENGNTCSQCVKKFYLSIDKKQCIYSKVDQRCAVQQNLQCQKCKNHYYLLDQNQFTILDKSFLNYYDTQNFYYQKSCQEIPNKVENCESYNKDQQCILCKVGYYLKLDSIIKCESIENNQSESLIENCIQLQTKDTCYKCDLNYHPSLDRKQCILISQQLDCKKYLNNLNGNQPYCEECNQEYYMTENNTCMIRNNYPIESCQQYSQFEDKCLDCGDNKLSNTQDYCIQETDNCIKYDQNNINNNISKCQKCIDPYIIQNNECKEGSILNCIAYDQNTLECIQCQNQYYLHANDQQQQCILQQQVDNCDIYYSEIQEIQQYSCKQCQSGFLLQNIENQCISINTQNCEEENQEGQCFECKQGYQKINENGNIICIEKLNKQLDEQCQLKEDFIYILGWEEYDNKQCQICNEDYIPRYILGQCVSQQIASQRENYVEDCISFDSNMKCQLCKQPKVLYDNQCLQECPIDSKIQNQERNFIIKKNQCIEKIYYEDEYLTNCDIRTRRAYTLLDIINREYCLKCDNNSIPTIGHSFYRINLINSQFDETNNFDEFHPLIKCQDKEPLFQEIQNCEYYGQKNEFQNQLVCKRCKHGFREDSNLLFEDQPILEACENQLDNNCLSCQLGYYIKFFDSIGGNACYLPKNYYQNCSEQIAECSNDTYQQVPGDLMEMISCQKCSNNKVPIIGVKQRIVQNQQFNFEISEYLFTHQALPDTNKMVECIDFDQIEINYNIPQEQLDIENPNGFNNCAIFGISKSYPNQTNNQIHCLACKPGFYTPNKPFRSDVCQPIPNCLIAGNKVNTCEQLEEGYYWGVQEQLFEMPSKIYHQIQLDQNCQISFQDRGCLICKKGFELDESLQCIQAIEQNCQDGNYYLPTLYLERNQINLLTFLQTSNFGFGCYQCQQGFVAFNDRFRKFDNRFNPLIDQGVQEITFVEFCIQYQLQDNIQDQLLKGNDCIKCQSGRNLNTTNNKCEPINNVIDFCLYYVNNQCIQCQQGSYYLSNGQCEISNQIENCIEYQNQDTCIKCQDQQNQQYELIDNECLPKFICNEQFITTDYMSIQNQFFNGIKCDDEFKDLNVLKFQAKNSQLEVISCKENFKVDNGYLQFCLSHNFIDNCSQYDQNLQRHLLFDLNSSCIKCNKFYYLQQNQCLQRNNTQNCYQFEDDQDKCKICDQFYYLQDGICLEANDKNCEVFKQNENKCEKCKEDYIINDQQLCELYHFQINNCLEYSNFQRYCSKCEINFYLSQDNLSCLQRQNYQIDFCDIYFLNQDNCQSCQTGYYLQENLIQCTQIQNFVQNCERPLSLNKCFECNANYILSEDKTQCNEVQNTLENCLRYIDIDNCYECQNGAQLYENQCYIPDQYNCLLYDQDLCQVCADGYSYDNYLNICYEENYQSFCEQCSNKQTLQCSQHCSIVDNCEKMTWYGRCEKCQREFILSHDQSRCYKNNFDEGCELLVETKPLCKTCIQNFKEFRCRNNIYCFKNRFSNCVQKDESGNCQLCKPGTYQTTEGLCKSNQIKSRGYYNKNYSSDQKQDKSSSASDEDKRSSESSESKQARQNRKK